MEFTMRGDHFSFANTLLKFLALVSLLFLVGCKETPMQEFDESIPDTFVPPASGDNDTSQLSAIHLYDQQCANCHGANGIGGGAGGELYQCDVCDDWQQLYQRIYDSMPIGSAHMCSEDCSRKLSNLIFSDFANQSGADPGDQDVIGEAPIANYTRSQNLIGTVPLTAQFNASASSDADGSIVSYVWTFADGSTVANVTTERAFTAPGNHPVTLTVVDDNGNEVSTTFIVQTFAVVQNQPPQPFIASSVSQGAVPLTIQFDATSSTDDNGIVAYHWDFGDGNTATGVNAEHRFTQHGQLQVTLTVTDTNGVPQSTTHTLVLTANNPPLADASRSTNLSGEAPLVVTFDATASSDDGAIMSYRWDFGDGNTATGAQVNHEYTQVGSFTVMLTVVDNDGIASTSSVAVNVSRPIDNEPPTASASLSSSTGVAPRTIQFSSNGSSQDVVSFYWEFGDGQTSNQRNPSHRYESAGTFNGFLRVSDGELTDTASFSVNLQSEAEAARSIYQAQCASCHGSDGMGRNGNPALTVGRPLQELANIVLTMPPEIGLNCGAIDNCQTMVAQYILNTFVRNNIAPVADLSASRNLSGAAPLNAQFNASASRDDHGIVEYSWNFGDGTSSSGIQVSHAYATPGNYTVRLMVVDEEGLSSSATTTVEVIQTDVNQPPVADTGATTGTTGLAPLTVIFDGSRSADDERISEYLWNFGDGTQSQGPLVQHTYQNPGNYTASLTVSDGEFSDSQQLQIQALSPTQIAAGIYQQQCSTCHGSNGQGVQNNPALTIGRPLAEQIEIVREMPPNIGIECNGIANCEIYVAQYVLDNFARDNNPPVANTSETQTTTGVAPFNARFNGSASSDDHGIVEYRWDFGDGTSGTGVEVNHAYAAPGSYTARLTVRDEEGATSTASIGITVEQADTNQPPVADTSASTGYTGVAPLNVNFNASLSADDHAIVRYHWDFGDGSSAEGLNVAHTYNDVGHYTVTLTVYDAEALSSQDNLTVVASNDSENDPGQYFQCDINEPGPSTLKRLSHNQYRNTLRDLLDWVYNTPTTNSIMQGAEEFIHQMPEDEHESGFHQIDQRVSSFHLDSYIYVASYIAEQVTADNPRLSTFVGESCATNASDQACKTRFIRNFGERALRRAITDEDVSFYLQTEDYEQLIAVMLMSPDFIYHTEFEGTPVNGRADLISVNGYELASRLSYLYWNSMPDQQLFADARDGSIFSNFAEVQQRVFNDPKTRTNMSNFFHQWLKLDEVAEINTGNIPGFNDYLQIDYADPQGVDTSLSPTTDLLAYRDDAVNEILRLADYVTWQSNGSLEDLFTNHFSFATDPNLAKAYGVTPWVAGDYNNLVTFPAGQRSGVLTRAAVHIYGGINTRPIMKGVRIRDDLLCDELVVPADNTPPDSAVVEPDFSQREKTTAITEVPGSACISCHQPLINPLGFASEEFDSLGRFRFSEFVFDLNGNQLAEVPVNSVVTPAINSGDSTITNNMVELSSLLSESGKIKACFARKYFRFAYSRIEQGIQDDCALSSMFEALRDENLQGALRNVSGQAQFQLRKLPQQP